MALGLYRITDPPCIPGLVGCDPGTAVDHFGLGIVPLPAPPCIPGLIGCDGMSTDGTGGLDQQISSLDSGALPDLSGIAALSPTPSSNASSSSSETTSGLSFPSRISRGREALAQYVLSAKNKGADALNGVKIWHGPLPFGAVFEPSKSSAGCTQEGSSVACVTDLAAGQSKEFTVVYRVSSSVSCAIARVLQKATIAARQVTGTAPSQVSVSVQCSMFAPDASLTAAIQSKASESSSSGAVIPALIAAQNPQQAGLHTDQGDAYRAGIEAGGACIAGYKGKGGCPEAPRTGAALSYFAAAVTDGTSLTPFLQPESFTVSNSVWFGVVSLIVIAVFSFHSLKKVIFKKSA